VWDGAVDRQFWLAGRGGTEIFIVERWMLWEPG